MPQNNTLSEAIKRMAYRSGYSAAEGTVNAVVKRWLPVAKVLRQGGAQMTEAVMILLTGKADGLKTNFHAFKCIEGLQDNEMQELLPAFSAEDVSSTSIKGRASKIKAKRAYNWHFQAANPLVHSSRNMSRVDAWLQISICTFL